MIKLPTMPRGASEEEVERRTQFMHDLAALLAVWAELEMAIEVKIAQLTGMAPLDASIVLGSLQSGTRRNILFSLLRERKQAATISKVKEAISFAKRNALVHSQFAAEDNFSLFRLYQREVKDKYRVIKHDFTAETFHQHFLKFRKLHMAATHALGITHKEIVEYGRAAQFGGLDQ